MKRRSRISLVIAILMVVTATLACQSNPGNSGDIPSPPGGQIPVSREAADRLRENFNREMQEASTGEEFRLFVTNEEVTSLAATYAQGMSGITLTNPQVWFTAGRIYITGTFSPTWPFSFQSLIVATALVQDGQLKVEVEEAQMGPFPFPERVLSSASQSINETLSEMQLDLQVTALEILEGELQVAGTRRSIE